MMLAALATSSLASETGSQPDQAVVRPADFSAVTGASWSGFLVYLDYSSHTEKRIPVEVQFEKPGKRSVIYRIRYPGETQHNAKEKLQWSRNGRKLNGKPIVSRSRTADGSLILVTHYDGEDNNRPATIRMTYSIGASVLVISKDVRFDDSVDFFRRNAYELVR